MSITDRIQTLRDPQGFYEAWMEEVRKGKGYKQAYHDLEAQYTNLQKQAGIPEELTQHRYKTYNSFRVSRRNRKEGEHV